MKISWKSKQKSGSKRSLPLVSPNLPFESAEEEDGNCNNNNKTSNVTEASNTTIEEQNKKKKLDHTETDNHKTLTSSVAVPEDLHLSQTFQSQGNKLAEDGRYKEALTKWEAALTLTPDRAVLHEQKAQILLEIGETWNALKAATRATELEPSWSEAWVTLARTQLNFGEPDASIESLDKALAIQPDSKEAQDDRETALHLVKKRKQLHESGLNETDIHYTVGDRSRTS
ncbi:tetratricopeptide repeat protein 33-like [Papaver somniferum]|uniref:tetratricopeptide repeat protein 33-like n=1 Tax=Papaver somniferum TaxID=3469 RepID=UPI000E6F7CA6|nr:tetratricopeptide repeat protein 33-like [Papaver somniferum]